MRSDFSYTLRGTLAISQIILSMDCVACSPKVLVEIGENNNAWRGGVTRGGGVA